MICTPDACAGVDKGVRVVGKDHAGSLGRSDADAGGQRDKRSTESSEERELACSARGIARCSGLGVVGEMIADHEKGVWRPFGVLYSLRKAGGAYDGEGGDGDLIS